VIYYDTNQRHWVRDCAAYLPAWDTIMLRACWRDGTGVFCVDSWSAEERYRFNDLVAPDHYQRVWDGSSPEWQADCYADTIGSLRANEWPMVDVESGAPGSADFLLRVVGRYEFRQQRSAAVYAPLALWNTLLPVIGNRLKVPQLLTSAVVGGLRRVKGLPHRHLAAGTRDPNRTDLSAAPIPACTDGGPGGGSYRRRLQMLND
jgi:hypothetical protein